MITCLGQGVGSNSKQGAVLHCMAAMSTKGRGDHMGLPTLSAVFHSGAHHRWPVLTNNLLVSSR